MTTATGPRKAVAHIITADAVALGDPEIIIMTPSDETGAADEIERIELDAECEGHESLDGAHMGETDYCDGSCRPLPTILRELGAWRADLDTLVQVGTGYWQVDVEEMP